MPASGRRGEGQRRRWRGRRRRRLQKRTRQRQRGGAAGTGGHQRTPAGEAGAGGRRRRRRQLGGGAGGEDAAGEAVLGAAPAGAGRREQRRQRRRWGQPAAPPPRGERWVLGKFVPLQEGGRAGSRVQTPDLRVQHPPLWQLRLLRARSSKSAPLAVDPRGSPAQPMGGVQAPRRRGGLWSTENFGDPVYWGGSIAVLAQGCFEQGRTRAL